MIFVLLKSLIYFFFLLTFTDIIVYSCQACSFETHKRDQLVEHYQNIHGKDATREELKPKTKPQLAQQQAHPDYSSLQNTQLPTASCTTVQEQNEQMNTFKVLSNNTQTQILNPNSSFTTFNAFGGSSSVDSMLNPLNQYTLTPTTAGATVLTLPSATTTVPSFNAFDQNQFSLQPFQVQPLTAAGTSASIGNEFIVMADGSVEQVFGKGKLCCCAKCISFNYAFLKRCCY